MDTLKVYLQSGKESIYENGINAGFSEERAINFSYSIYEISLTVEVNDNGDATIIAVNDSPLVTPVAA